MCGGGGVIFQSIMFRSPLLYYTRSSVESDLYIPLHLLMNHKKNHKKNHIFINMISVFSTVVVEVVLNLEKRTYING